MLGRELHPDITVGMAGGRRVSVLPFIQGELAPVVRMGFQVSRGVERLFRKAEQGFAVSTEAFLYCFRLEAVVFTLQIGITVHEQLFVVLREGEEPG